MSPPLRKDGLLSLGKEMGWDGAGSEENKMRRFAPMGSIGDMGQVTDRDLEEHEQDLADMMRSPSKQSVSSANNWKVPIPDVGRLLAPLESGMSLTPSPSLSSAVEQSASKTK